MHENNFERTIQEKMSELRFDPSAPVWAQVEAQIRAKKKKRRAIFWLFFGLLLLGGTGSLLLWNRDGESAPNSIGAGNGRTELPAGIQPENSNSEEKASTAVNKPNTVTRPAAAPDAGVTATNPATAAPSGAHSATPTAARPNVKATATTAATGSNVATTRPVISTHAQGLPTIAKVKPRLRRRAEGGKTPAALARNTRNKRAAAAASVRNQPTTPIDAPNDLSIATTTPIAKASPDSTTKTIDTSAVAKTVAPGPRADSTQKAPATPTPQHQRKRPEWSILAFGGINSAKPSTGTGYADVASSPVAFAPMVVTRARPAYTHGPQLGIEVQAALPLSKRVSVYAGAGYCYFSMQATVSDSAYTSAGIGTVLPSASRVDRWESSATYRWHYATLSAGIRWKPVSLPLYASVGLTLAAQVSTRNWTYESSSGSFLASDAATNRLQAFARAGLEYRIWQHGSKALLLGPQAGIGLSRTQPYGGYRLSHWGVQARFRF